MTGSVVTVAYTLTSSPGGVVLRSAFLHGVVGGVPWVVSEIWMNVVVEEKRRGRVMGVYAHAGGAGPGAGTARAAGDGRLRAGAVPDLRGAGPAGGAAAAALLEERAGASSITADSGFAIVVVAAPLAMFAGFVCGLGEQVAFSFLPVYAVGAGVSAETGALWLSAFVIGNVILQWPIGWLADHYDRRAVLAGCTLASAVLVDAAADRAGAVARRSIGVVLLWGGISFAIYPVGLALLGQRFNGGDIARANTAFSLLYILGGLVGRPLTGAAMDAIGDPGLGWTLAVLLCRRRRRAPCWRCAVAADKSAAE